MPVYTVHEAETQLSKLMERAERGEEVIVARGDKPAMRIAPVAPANKPKRQPGMLKGVIPEPPDSVFFDPRPEEELKPWEEDYLPTKCRAAPAKWARQTVAKTRAIRCTPAETTSQWSQLEWQGQTRLIL